MERFDEWDSFLCHHGIKGQKHGVRNYQYEDGSLTPAGRERYGVGEKRTGRAEAVKPAKSRSASKSSSANVKTTKRMATPMSRAEKAKMERKVRRKEAKAERKAKIKARISELYNKSAQAVKNAYLKKHPEKMSDEQLQKYVTRLALEKQYKDLSGITAKENLRNEEARKKLDLKYTKKKIAANNGTAEYYQALAQYNTSINSKNKLDFERKKYKDSRHDKLFKSRKQRREEAEQHRLDTERKKNENEAARLTNEKNRYEHEQLKEQRAEEKAERKRLAAEKAERKQRAAERAESRRLAAEKEKAERLAAEKAERERRERIEKEQRRYAADEALRRYREEKRRRK